jgi:D-glycero-alpha-D-manno-heptose-7-phosphate kinase
MPYAAEYGGRVLSATISLSVRATVGQRLPGMLPGVAETSHFPDPPDAGAAAFDIAWELLGRPGTEPPEYRTDTAGLSGSGLGTSSAAIVALLSALAVWCGRQLDRGELARLAYHVERERLGQAGGAQDQYSAAFGGMNLIEFGADGTGTVTPLRLAPRTQRQLENCLLLCDTGRRRDARTTPRGQAASMAAPGTAQISALHRLKELAAEMRDLLTAGDVAGFGERMGRAWEQKLTLLGNPDDNAMPGTADVFRMLGAARAAGAVSGRTLGAAGGGFLLFFVPPVCRRAVSDVLRASGGMTLPVRLCATGTVIEHGGYAGDPPASAPSAKGMGQA